MKLILPCLMSLLAAVLLAGCDEERFRNSSYWRQLQNEMTAEERIVIGVVAEAGERSWTLLHPTVLDRTGTTTAAPEILQLSLREDSLFFSDEAPKPGERWMFRVDPQFRFCEAAYEREKIVSIFRFKPDMPEARAIAAGAFRGFASVKALADGGVQLEMLPIPGLTQHPEGTVLTLNPGDEIVFAEHHYSMILRYIKRTETGFLFQIKTTFSAISFGAGMENASATAILPERLDLDAPVIAKRKLTNPPWTLIVLGRIEQPDTPEETIHPLAARLLDANGRPRQNLRGFSGTCCAETVETLDVNFDGFDDILIHGNCEGDTHHRGVWLYEPQNEQFRYRKDFSFYLRGGELELHSKERRILIHRNGRASECRIIRNTPISSDERARVIDGNWTHTEYGKKPEAPKAPTPAPPRQ